ncbi:MAG: Na/Pi symporter [Candidatus Bathyarchaeota archaeon]|nr:Na/Pi symporter [Candidatus Bathyarchaeota archaeon]
MGSKYGNIIGSLVALYFFISAIMLIKESAGMMAAFLAEKIVLVIRDTTSGVFAGWLGTALLHSSGAFDSIIVAFVSSGAMPIGLAVSTIIGAELGTTVTPFLISVLNQVRKKQHQDAAFNVTLTHVIYNLCILAIFYPAELFFGTLTWIALQGSNVFVKAPWLNAIPDFLDVATPWVPVVLQYIPPWLGIILGAVMLILALGGVEKYMTEIFNMPRSWNLIRATFQKPYRAFLAGFLFTLLIPSTTVMVSLLVPLATSGVLGAEFYILPYILGANIGTVFDVMIAAMATGDPIALGVWLVHLSVNVIGALIFLPLMKPFSRVIKATADKIAASPRLTLVVAAVFHIIPAVIILFYVFSA